MANPIDQFAAGARPKIGDTVRCRVTGEVFVVAADGCSFNYALDFEGFVISDAGVLQTATQRLLCDSQHHGYISSDGKTYTTWKGQRLGDVVRLSRSKSGFHGSSIVRVSVHDLHGAYWYGSGSGEGMCISLRRRKTAV